MPLVNSEDKGGPTVFDLPYKGVKMYKRPPAKKPGPVTEDDILLAGPVRVTRYYVGHNEYKHRLMERGGDIIQGESPYDDTEAGLLAAQSRAKVLNKKRAETGAKKL